ncbi:MAG: hypothetical protein JWN70_5214 [Planctomycetaceae bacterium]|nr:hypothetical protein [Planctomycetaceae bacterium]
MNGRTKNLAGVMAMRESVPIPRQQQSSGASPKIVCEMSN